MNDENFSYGHCTGKQAFRDKAAALRVLRRREHRQRQKAARSRGSGGRFPAVLDPYRCSMCGLWHLGGRHG